MGMPLLILALGLLLMSCGSQSATPPTSQSPSAPSSPDTSNVQAQYEQWFASIKRDDAMIQRDELKWAKLENSSPTYAEEGALATRLADDFQRVQYHANSVSVPSCAEQAKHDYVNAAGLLQVAFQTIARDTANMTQYGADYDQAITDIFNTYEPMLDSARNDAANACQ